VCFDPIKASSDIVHRNSILTQDGHDGFNTGVQRNDVGFQKVTTHRTSEKTPKKRKREIKRGDEKEKKMGNLFMLLF
jgi:hypothetical protein